MDISVTTSPYVSTQSETVSTFLTRQLTKNLENNYKIYKSGPRKYFRIRPISSL